MVITLANQVSIYLDRHAAVYSTKGQLNLEWIYEHIDFPK